MKKTTKTPKNHMKMDELDVKDYGNQSIEEIERQLAEEKKVRKANFKHFCKDAKRVIIGTVKLIVVAQLVYNTAILLGVEMPFSKWMVIPQIAFAVWIAFKEFTNKEKH